MENHDTPLTRRVPEALPCDDRQHETSALPPPSALWCSRVARRGHRSGWGRRVWRPDLRGHVGDDAGHATDAPTTEVTTTIAPDTSPTTLPPAPPTTSRRPPWRRPPSLRPPLPRPRSQSRRQRSRSRRRRRSRRDSSWRRRSPTSSLAVGKADGEETRALAAAPPRARFLAAVGVDGELRPRPPPRPSWRSRSTSASPPTGEVDQADCRRC